MLRRRAAFCQRPGSRLPISPRMAILVSSSDSRGIRTLFIREVESRLVASFANTAFDVAVYFLLFPTPGEYQVSFTQEDRPFSRNPMDLDSPIAIKVVEPTRPVDLFVYEKLRNDPMLLTAMIPFHDDRSDHVSFYQMVEIARDHKESSYADYARFGLARQSLFSSDGLPDIYNPLIATPRMNLQFALDEMKDIDIKTFAFGAHVLALRRMVYHEMGRDQEASDVARQLDLRFPHSFVRYQDYRRRYPTRDWPGPRNPHIESKPKL